MATKLQGRRKGVGHDQESVGVLDSDVKGLLDGDGVGNADTRVTGPNQAGVNDVESGESGETSYGKQRPDQ